MLPSLDRAMLPLKPRVALAPARHHPWTLVTLHTVVLKQVPKQNVLLPSGETLARASVMSSTVETVVSIYGRKDLVGGFGGEMDRRAWSGW